MSKKYTEGYLTDMWDSLWDKNIPSTVGKIDNFLDKIGPEDPAQKRAQSTLGAPNDTLNKLGQMNQSIVARAKRSILQFPIYVTKSIRATEAQVVAKLFERVYATYVQTALSQNPIISIEDANNMMFLQGYHTNLNESVDPNKKPVDEKGIDELDQMIQDSKHKIQKISENCTVEFEYTRLDRKTHDILYKENARLAHPPLTGLNHIIVEAHPDPMGVKDALDKRPLQSRDIENTVNNLPERTLGDMDLELLRNQIRDENGKPKFKDVDALKGAIVANMDSNDSPIMWNNRVIHWRTVRENNPTFVKDADGNKVRIDNYSDRLEFYLPQFSGDKFKSRFPDGVNMYAPELLVKDTDIKKFNAMLPYTMKASFYIQLANGNLSNQVTFIIGVKSVMHLIDPVDLSNDLPDIINGNNRRLQKVRYSTGEIGLSEFLFDITNLKKDASRHLNKNTRWLNTLKRLGEYSKLRGNPMNALGGVMNGTNPFPIGTLIITQSDVTKIAADTGIDLAEISNARRLANSLFLIGVAIIDSVAGVLKTFFPDNDVDWDIQSIAAIDRETAQMDNSAILRELNKMVNK